MTIILSITLIVQLSYWLFIFNKLSEKDNYFTKAQLSIPLSIIICAKDEYQQLKSNIPFIFDQNYTPKEVIIANDFSTDGSTNYLKGIDSEKMDFRYYEVKQNKRGKKQALKEAIGISKNKYLLLTDADCRPASNEWIQQMANRFSDKVDIVLGYSPYRLKNTWLSYWIHYEGWLIGVQYLSYCLLGMPYMGVGRNLAYKRSIFSESIVDRHADLSSGDDDLLINQVSDKNNTTICLDKKSFVYTDPPKDLASYLGQKRRHNSTASRYKWTHILLLGSYNFSQILFFALILLCIANGSLILGATFYLLRMLFIVPIVSKLKDVLDAQFKLLHFPILDFIQAIYYLLISFTVFIPQKNKW